MIKIAFAGKKESGKTTLAEYCADVHELEAFSFADDLKMNLVELGIKPDRVFGSSNRDANARKLMQAYGQAMRDQDEDYWLDLVMKNMRLWESSGASTEGFVIDDLRYMNEAEALRADGFVLIKVVRGNYKHAPDDHSSEQGLPDQLFDNIIVADDGDLDSLFSQIDTIIEHLEVNNG